MKICTLKECRNNQSMCQIHLCIWYFCTMLIECLWYFLFLGCVIYKLQHLFIYIYIADFFFKWRIQKQVWENKIRPWSWWRLINQLGFFFWFFWPCFLKRITVTDCWWQTGEFRTHSLTYFSVQIIHEYSCENCTSMCNGTISFLSALLQPSHRANRKW